MILWQFAEKPKITMFTRAGQHQAQNRMRDYEHGCPIVYPHCLSRRVNFRSMKLFKLQIERIGNSRGRWCEADFLVAAGDDPVAAQQQGFTHFAEQQADQPGSQEG